MKLVGLSLVFLCTFGGLFIAMQFDYSGFSKLMFLILGAMPGEMVIIGGCAVAAFLVANSRETIKGTISYLSAHTKPSAHSKEDYVELMGTLFVVFKLVRTKGWLALEQHIEQPDRSDLFAQFPSLAANSHAIVFLCDYLRIISMGNENPHELEALMDEEIETIEHHETHPGHAMQTMADGIPALGIVAAVLGVIKTMTSINEPPEVLGKLIGAALVGTFLGVWLAYTMVGPVAGAMRVKAESKVMYYKSMKVGIIAFLNGASPHVAVEFSRKLLPHDLQPSFQELEEHLSDLPALAAA